jgi:hypothetical protein
VGHAAPGAVSLGRLRSVWLAAALALIGVFGVARAVAPGAAAVIVLTIPIGVGWGSPAPSCRWR